MVEQPKHRRLSFQLPVAKFPNVRVALSPKLGMCRTPIQASFKLGFFLQGKNNKGRRRARVWLRLNPDDPPDPMDPLTYPKRWIRGTWRPSLILKPEHYSA